MAVDEENADSSRNPRRRKNAGSDSSLLKILLIVFGCLGGLVMLGCCGSIGAAYFFGQKLMKDIAITNPADIQRVTGEITDITIPAEFVPKSGTSFFGFMKMILYEWCPTGSCAPRQDQLGTMMLMSVKAQGGQGQQQPPIMDFSDSSLKQQWRDFTKTEHEFTIRGRKSTFYIVQGEQTGGIDGGDDDMEEDKESQQPATTVEVKTDEGQTKTETTPAPQMPTAVSVAGRKTVLIYGQFRGKDGECTLLIQLSPDEYDEDKILGMLKSIR